MPTIFQSLIQSDFGGDHGNFEAVIREGDTLVHWWRDNGEPGLWWQRGPTIVPAGVAGAGAIIQSDFGSDGHGNFEVVVPLLGPAGRTELWHFFRDNNAPGLPWKPGTRVTADTDDVAGPAALIQSDFPLDQDHKNFELVVPLRVADGRVELWHFFRDNGAPGLPWKPGARVADNVTGPGALIRSDFPLAGGHKNFEVVVPEGRRLTHYFRDNSNDNLPWQRSQFVTESLDGWASLIRSDFPRDQEHKNFEVLLEGCDGSVIGYWHPNVDTSLPWLRDKAVIPRGYQVLLPDTRKIAQLTGEFDQEGWDGVAPRRRTRNQTESRFGIRGTDLGSSFVHRGRTYFLFGDAFRINQTKETSNLDSIAFTTDTNPDDEGLDLTFLDCPPLIHPPIPQQTYNVPLDGVSVNDSMFVFFSTDHKRVDEEPLMGRSVLTRSTNDGFDFDLLYEFSSDKFINVSVERVTLDEMDAEAVGVGTRDVLCVWGAGPYRSGDVRLAILPVAELMTGRGRRFYAGSDGRHVWSNDERDAAPLFCSGCIAELSARWNPFLKRFLVTYNNRDSPKGIVLHAAPKPWGPWTHEPVMVFDPNHRSPGLDPNDPCLGDGYGKFMHIPWNWKKCDNVYDDFFQVIEKR